MQINNGTIPGVKIIVPSIFKDERGEFRITFEAEQYKENDIPTVFPQENTSVSHKNVLRGLHFQDGPFEQGKLITVTKGSVLDVIVDLRPGSEFFGKHMKILLNEDNKLLAWVPRGFAHGFLSLEDNTVFNYKCDNVYNKESESGIMWDDKDLGIDWEVKNPIISEKDKKLLSFSSFSSKLS